MPKRKDEDAPEAVAARDREPTPEGQRAADIVEQVALDAGQIPGPAEGTAEGSGATEEREITDNVSGQDL